MSKARQQANLSSDGNLFADISNDRVGVGSVVPTHKLHVAGTSKFDDDVKFEGTTAALNIDWDKSANTLNFSDNTELTFGDANNGDLRIVHNGSGSIIKNTTGNLFVYGTQAKIGLKIEPDAKVRLYYNGSAKFETSNTGAKVLGNLEVTGVLTYEDVTSIDSVGIVTARAGIHAKDDVTFYGDTSGRDVFWDKSANTLLVKDSAFLNIGTGNDLQIYHNPSNNNSYISEQGSGSLVVLADDFYIQDTSTNSMIQCIEGAQVQLHYAGTKKFETYQYGVKSPGHIVASSDGYGFYAGAGFDIEMLHDGSNSRIKNITGDLEFQEHTSSGNIIFKTTTSGTERLRIASDGRVLIGHSSARIVTSTVNPFFQLEGTDHHASLSVIRNSANAPGPYLTLGKSRSGAVGGYTIIQDNDVLGAIRFAGADGVDMAQYGAEIAVIVDGTPGADSMPGEMIFRTNTGSGNPTEKLRITKQGIISINDPTPESFAALQIKNHTTTNIAAILLHGADAAQIIMRDDTGGTNTKCTTIRNDQGALIFGTHNDAYSGFSDKLTIKSNGQVHVGNAFSTAAIFGINVVDDTVLSDSMGLYNSSATNFIEVSNTGDGITAKESGILLRTRTSSAGVWAIYNKRTASYTSDLVFRTRTASQTSAERLRLTNAGLVGIGIAAPTEKLHVIGQVGGTNPTAGSKWDIARFVAHDYSPTNSGGLTIGAYWNSSTAGARRAYIQSSQNTNSGSTARALLLNPDGGDVIIGNTSAADSAHFQHYTSSTRYQSFQSTNGDLAIVTDNNSSPAVYIKGTGTADLLNVFDNTTEVFAIQDGGQVNIGSKIQIAANGNMGFSTSPSSSYYIDILNATSAYGMRLRSTGNQYQDLVFDANRPNAANAIGRIVGQWNGNNVAMIQVQTGDDTTNKDDGRIRFYTSESGGNVLERMEIRRNGTVNIGGSNEVQLDQSNDEILYLHGAVVGANVDFGYGMRIDLDDDATGTTTADRERGCALFQFNGNCAGGDTSNETRLWNIFSDVNCNEDYDNVYGLYSDVRTDHTAGTITEMRGVYGIVQNTNTGNVTNMTGLYGLVQSTSGANSETVHDMVGVRGRVNMCAGNSTANATDVVAVWGNIDNDNNTAQPSGGKCALFYGSYDKTTGLSNPYGINIATDVPNYFAGRVHISNTFTAHTAADDLIVGATSGSNGMTILTGDATGSIFFSNGTDNAGVIQYVHSGDDYMRIKSEGMIEFDAGDTEVVTIQANGEVAMKSSGEPTDALANLHVQNGTFRVSQASNPTTAYTQITAHVDGTDGNRHRIATWNSAGVCSFAVDQNGSVMGRASIYAGRTRGDANNAQPEMYRHGAHHISAYSARSDDPTNYRSTAMLRAWDAGDRSDRNVLYYVDSDSDTTTADWDQHQTFGIKASGLLQTVQAIWAGRCESDEGSPNSVFGGATTYLRAYPTSTSYHSTLRARETDNTDDVLYIDTGGGPVIKFESQGNGRFDGGADVGNASDYAEYFEWLDGNSSDADRRGITVVMDGEKVRPATGSDDTSKIIGVVSANPAVVGDSAWSEWQLAHKKDAYGSWVMEEHEYLVWNKRGFSTDGRTGVKTENPQPDITDPNMSADYQIPVSEIDFWKAKGDDFCPQWAIDQNIRIKKKSRTYNPDYDKTKTYVPRSDRKEWSAIGLVGKLVVRRGQPIGANWILMKSNVGTDPNDNSIVLDKYLVR